MSALKPYRPEDGDCDFNMHGFEGVFQITQFWLLVR